MTLDTLRVFIARPEPVERIVLLRVFAPLAVLGFMSTRVIYPQDWLGKSGFRVPDLGGDYRQPLFVPGLEPGLAWGIVVVLVTSGLATSAGFRTTLAALTFAATLAFVAVADRVSAFTVSKLSPVVALAIAAGAAGSRYGIDAALRRSTEPRPTHVPGGPLRFIQILLPVFYCASGICKAKGDWLVRYDVLWTQLHSSYQTGFAHWLAVTLPSGSWAFMQVTTLAFEMLAPLWFWLRKTRMAALLYGVAMHAMIGLMFGAVRWFALLMITLLLAAYLPETWLARLARVLEPRRREPATAT